MMLGVDCSLLARKDDNELGCGRLSSKEEAQHEQQVHCATTLITFIYFWTVVLSGAFLDLQEKQEYTL